MLTGVHLLLTYRCTHECDHCFVNAGPHAEGTFTRALLDDVIRQAAEVESVEEVWFEGGEPFLVYPLLLEGLRLAREAGLRTGVVSNAYWAETADDAALWLRPLRDLGLGIVLLSDDPYHHGDRDPSPAAMAKEAAEGLGLAAGTITIPRPDEGEGLRLRGRAAEKLVEGRPLLPAATFIECPDEDLRDPDRVHVDPFGHVHLCQGLLLGNVREKPLRRILEEHDPDADPVLGPLLRGGPAALAVEHGLPVEGGAASACHLCWEARRSLRAGFSERLGPAGVYGETPNPV